MRILYIDLDCCRADHLGCNGYLRDTSPNIDALADEGVSFTRCYCSNSPCVPSRASLFSGRFGFNNGVVAHHGGGERFGYEDIYDGHRRDPQRPMLAAHLWENGFKSAVDLYAAWEGLTGGDTSRPVDYMPDAIETTQDFKMLIDGYDASLAYADHHIGQVLEVLDGLGVLNDTAIIIGGDHGDSFGEHGQYLDHGIANEAVHNVPMIVRWPGVTMPAGRCESLIYALDLGPTLCELLDLPVPQGWDGRSFAAALHGEDYGGWPFLVWDHAIYTITRAIRTPEWLMIQVLHPGLYPYDDGVMLHDMHEDLHQEINSATEQLVVVAELNSLISEWRHEQILKSGGPDPLERMLSVGPFAYYTPEQMFARLERTNRSHIVPELRARLNRYHRQSHH